jgi:Spy/CpxP family protein refolding chaperone
MRKILIGIFIIISFNNAQSLNAYAQICDCMGGGGAGMQGGMMEWMESPRMGMMHGAGIMMAEEHPMWKYLMSLGLDDKQKEAIKTLRSKMVKDMTKKRADMIISGIELKDLLDKDPVDMKAVDAAVKKRESLRAEMFIAGVRAHEEMKAILTPEQRKRLKEMTESGYGAGCNMMGGAAEHKDMPMHEHMH